MHQFLVRRLIQSVLLLWALMTFTFFLTRLTPGGPEATFLDNPKLTPADIERMRVRFGLNDPPLVAYGKWMSGALTLDFGRSYAYLRPPLDVIGERIGPTMQLSAIAYCIALMGIPLGVIAAFHRGRVLDVLIRIFTVVGGAVPHWWMALVLIVAMSATIGWFPQGMGRGNSFERLPHYIIPAMILGLGGLVAFTRYVRSQVLEVIGQDYVRVARAKGLSEFLVSTRHVLRNALMPVVTLMAGLLPSLIGGAAITESIFNWPGMGRLFLEAASTRDYPLLLCILTITTIATLIGMLISDLLYGVVDPRIRYG
jgi:peptide/nickel transport system permease protein